MIRWVVSVLAVMGLAFAAAPRVAPADEVSYSDTGAYASAWRDIAIQRDDGSRLLAQVYYPVMEENMREGMTAGVASPRVPFPVIAFGHGYMQPVDSYAPVLRHLASHGFVVIAPRSFEHNPFPSHAQFGADLNAGLAAMMAQAGDSQSPFFGRIDPQRMGAMGHSMGGGAALLAASANDHIDALSVWAVVDTRPSAVGAVAGDTRPMQWIAGSDDGIVPADQRELWRSVHAPAPMQIPVIAGGAHCGFQSQSAFALFCDRGKVSKAEQIRITQQLLTDWFALYLRDDQARWDSVWGQPLPQVSLTTRNADAAFPAGNALR
jgi:dienelactone hydrolase